MNDEQTREQQLVAAARDGDESAFETLVRLYEKRVFGLAVRMCGGREDAAGAAQEAPQSTWIYQDPPVGHFFRGGLFGGMWSQGSRRAHVRFGAGKTAGKTGGRAYTAGAQFRLPRRLAGPAGKPLDADPGWICL